MNSSDREADGVVDTDGLMLWPGVILGLGTAPAEVDGVGDSDGVTERVAVGDGDEATLTKRSASTPTDPLPGCVMTMVSAPLPRKLNVPRSKKLPLPPVRWLTVIVIDDAPPSNLTVCGTVVDRDEWEGYVTNTWYVP